MKPRRDITVTCPRCRAINEHGMAECFLCEMRLAGLRADPPADSGPRFRLATLMVLIAVIAAVLALWREAPGLAALAMVPGGIGMVRVFVLSGERYGRPPSMGEYVWAFTVTFCFVVVLMASSVAAFFVTCLAMLNSGNGSGTLMCSGIAAIAAPVSLLIIYMRSRSTRFRDGPPSRRR